VDRVQSYVDGLAQASGKASGSDALEAFAVDIVAAGATLEPA
jgi:hypothetical protein